MRRSEDKLRFKKVRRARDVVVSIGAATHIGAALRAAKRNAEAEELARHLQGLRSLNQDDLSVVLVTQWLEEQLRSIPRHQRVMRQKRCALSEIVDRSGLQGITHE